MSSFSVFINILLLPFKPEKQLKSEFSENEQAAIAFVAI